VALQVAALLLGLGLGALLVHVGRRALSGDATGADVAVPAPSQRIEAASRESARLKAELERAEAARSQALVEGLSDPNRSYEDVALVGRLKARDTIVREGLEKAAQAATGATRAAWLHGVLFVGTGDPRRLEQAFEARALPDEADWAEVIGILQLDERLSNEQLALILEQIDELAKSDRAAALTLLEAGFARLISREQVADPRAHDRIVALAREGVLAGQIGCFLALPDLSADAALATAATFLADSKRPLEPRGKLLGKLAESRALLPEALVETLPAGETPADWQAWIDANSALVERGMAVGR
jgi:hypothetical protein